MRRFRVLLAAALLVPAVVAVGAGADQWCTDAGADERSAEEALPKQGVVQIHHLTSGTHFQPSAVTPSGALQSVDLLGHDGGPRLVSVWQTPAACAGTARDGAWAVTPEGHVFIGGTAQHFGHMLGRTLNQPIVGMAPSPTGAGYWLVASDGGIFSFGDARFLGSTGAITLNQPIVAMAATPSGNGYWLAAADGGLFAFGDAPFLGSMGGTPLNKPIVGMIPTPTGRGYWMVAEDGGIFTFGDARFKGSTASSGSTTPVVGMVPNVGGYTIVDAVGNITSFGAAGGSSTTGGHDHGDDETTAAAGPIISLDDPRVTSAQRGAAQDLIDRTTAGMARFTDEASLRAAGYVTIGDGATGFEHYVNYGMIIDAYEVDPSRIESVVLRVQNGVKTIASAMYILSAGKGMADVPDIAGELTTWHDHTDLCFEGGRVVGLADDGVCSRGTLTLTPPMLHVWMTEHPCGPFAGIETSGHGGGCEH